MTLKHTGISLLAALFMLAMAASSGRADETYRVNLSPPTHPGQKFQYSAVERESTTSADLQSADSELRFSAIATVERCSIDRPIKVRLSEASLKNVMAQEMLPPRELTVERVAITEQKPRTFKDVFAINDEPVTAPYAAALSKVITLGGEIEPSEQQLIGPDKPLAEGDTWAISGQQAAKVFQKFHMKVDPLFVFAEGQFVERLKFRNEFDAYKVSIGIRAERFLPKGDEAGIPGTARARLMYYIDAHSGLILQASYQVTTDVPTTSPNHDTRTFFREIKMREVGK